MKVLIITYYWPPAGGSGVQRWLKFVKYLRDFDIEPVVYTVDSPNYVLADSSLESDVPDGIEVLKQPIWEPNNLFSLFETKKKTSAGFLNPNPSFFGKIAHYIRANYFIPDARKFWIQPSIKYLSNYLKDHTIDTVITTGPPHSMHLIGMGLKEQLNIKWIADFRDPWTEIDYFHQLPLTKHSLKKHQALEEKVLTKADAIIVVGKTMAANFKKIANNVTVITNGYDTTNLTADVPLDKNFSMVHVGLLNSDRNHRMLWQVLAELCNENATFKVDLQLKFVGKVADDIIDSIEEFGLSSKTEFINYLPHAEVLAFQKSAQVLLLPINKVSSANGIVTGKIFEYLQANRPILAIAPRDGDLAEIIKETKAGAVVEFDDAETLKSEIVKLYTKFKNQTLKVSHTKIKQYHRKELTSQLAELIKNINP